MPTSLLTLLLPELILVAAAALLFLMGLSDKSGTRRLTPWIAMLALAACFAIQVYRSAGQGNPTQYDEYGGAARATTLAGNAAAAAPAAGIPTPVFYGTLRAADFTQYVKLITAGIGMLLLLLAWPAGREATGNTSLNFGNDAGEFFALMLLSLAGVLLVAGANDIMLLFLGIELASIPTYIMVSLSRPLPVAQEAGVKYFFLGAFAAAICGTSNAAPANHNAAVTTSNPSLRRPVFIMSPPFMCDDRRGHSRPLLDYPIGTNQDRLRDRDPERLRGLQVYHQF